MQKLKQKIELLQKMMEKIKKIDKKMVFYLVNQFQQTLNLTTILQTIQINRSTYYWLKIQNKLKEKEKKYLLQQKRIKALCLNYQYFYGHRKITDLYQKTFNEKISKKKVSTIMKKNDIRCRLRIKKIFTYCNLKNNLQIIPNLINQDFMTTKLYGHRKITDLYQKTFNEKISKKKVSTIMKKNDIRCRLRIKKIFTYCNLKNN
ncbi:IS3 family transposase, partial [Candidatus Phytoplasma citri]